MTTSTSYEWIIVALILSPLLFSCIAFVLSKQVQNVVLFSVTLQCTLWVLGLLWLPDASFSINVGGWQPPLGIRLNVSGAGFVLAGFCSLLFLLISLYARSEIPSRISQIFWPLLSGLQTGITGLFFTHDLFNAYIFLEITGLCAVGLVALSPGDKSYRIAFHYLSVNMIGSLSFLFGVALIYRAYGVLDFTLLNTAASGVQATPVAYLGFIMIITGLIVKSALAPVHEWLPKVHGSAMPVVSAMLSGLVVKGGIYLLFVLWWTAFAPLITESLVWLISLCGAAGILIGTVKALQVTHLKQMAAYSTVAQIGYLFLFLPLISQSAHVHEVLTGFLLFIIAHALAKTTLFLAVGYLKNVYHCITPASIAGFAQRQPIIIGAVGISAISLIGLPPSGGFTAKWALLSLHASAGSWLLFTVILAGSVISAACFFKILIHAFTSPSVPDPVQPENCTGLLQQRVLIAFLSLFTIVSGFCWPFIATFLQRGAI